MSDSLSVIIFWLTIFVIGIIFLPITTTIFRRFIDRGYIFSKVIGILISSYLMWFLGSLSLLPFTKLTLIVILLGFSIISMYIVASKKEKGSLPWRWIIFEELLFFSTLAFWSYIRAFEPSIRSLEKFMDFGFVNSILRSTYFPPLDMWLAKSPDYASGFFINYYYFGHYITAFLTKLSGLDSAITYNLMIAALFAFTFTLPFSIGVNLYYQFMSFRAQSRNLSGLRDSASKDLRDPSTRPSDLVGMTKVVIVGLLAAFLVSLGGNLHTLYAFTSGYPNEAPQSPWELELGFHPERYWYPNATRFIPFTIHEFPIYSFVVADLHGHVSDIPLVMLTLAILLTIIINHTSHLKNPTSHFSPPTSINSILQEFQNHTSIPLPTLILLGILLAVMYMTNAWDGLIYMLLTGLVFLCINLRNVIKEDSGQARMTIPSALYKTFSASLFLLFFFLLASLPFSLNFKPFVSGIGVLCAPKFLEGKALGPILFEAGKCQKSPFYQLAILWGFFYYNAVGFLLFVVIPALKTKWEMRGGKLDKEVGGGKRKLSHFSLLTSRLTYISPIDFFILLLIFISTLLLIFPEYLYIKDIYPAHYRANTMFKLGYQAFMMLGIASAYIFMRIKNLPYVIPSDPSADGESRDLSRMRDVNSNKLRDSSLSLGMTLRITYNIFFVLLFFLVAIYPQFAINSYYGNLQTYRGLYGLNWMAEQYPNDKNAIEWMRKNITGQPVIAEANGDSYTDYDRVSANTGLPTIIGWPVHEWLWRGSYDEAGRRIPEVAAIYESKDLELTKSILKKYNVEYIFVGNLEREKYKNLDEKKLVSLGKVIFESGRTKIIKIQI